MKRVDIYFLIRKYFDGRMSSIEQNNFFDEVKTNEELKKELDIVLILSSLQSQNSFDKVDEPASDFRKLANGVFKEWQEERTNENINKAFNKNFSAKKNYIKLMYVPLVVILFFVFIYIFKFTAPNEIDLDIPPNNLTSTDLKESNDWNEDGIVLAQPLKNNYHGHSKPSRQIALESVSFHKPKKGFVIYGDSGNSATVNKPKLNASYADCKTCATRRTNFWNANHAHHIDGMSGLKTSTDLLDDGHETVFEDQGERRPMMGSYTYKLGK